MNKLTHYEQQIVDLLNKSSDIEENAQAIRTNFSLNYVIPQLQTIRMMISLFTDPAMSKQRRIEAIDNILTILSNKMRQ